MKIELSAIAACAHHRIIGRNNELPWHVPEDLRFFHLKTKGHVLIMGRKTFECLRKPLPLRFHLVITRQKDYRVDHPDVKVVHLWEDAVRAAEQLVPPWPREVFVTGGGEIYQHSLPELDRIYLTQIDLEVEGDAKFPELPAGRWKLESEDRRPGPPALTFQTWVPTAAPVRKGIN
ncbi:MAG: hypothetical protein C5B49_13210 [Bdellovibrio sp.]|nr:MAG: hypothetical protein C5B49_13210 [Bdellovibrio sp.]